MFHFLRFHESFVVYIDFDNCQKELDLFKKEFSKVTVMMIKRNMIARDKDGNVNNDIHIYDNDKV